MANALEPNPTIPLWFVALVTNIGQFVRQIKGDPCAQLNFFIKTLVDSSIM
ncbi:hypothetical protein Syun_013278 [Stephania yunnanensis]|uniref:Uncharacterized protein n=1 Tax=Stephania yunnanensis TaxID=152371 RepID=A0AAP0K119_9MAGN